MKNTLSDAVEEVLFTVMPRDAAREFPVRLLTYGTGNQDVHFPYGGLGRDTVIRAATMLEQRGLKLQDNTGEPWPTGIYFKVDTAQPAAALSALAA